MGVAHPDPGGGGVLLLSRDTRLKHYFYFVFVLFVRNTRFCAVCAVCVVVGEFDPGSGRTLAACLTHASRTERPTTLVVGTRVANG